MEPIIPTLYQWAGGEAALQDLFRAFYDKVLQDEIGLPADPEFRSALVGYLEWGSRIAVLNSELTENPVADTEPMPRWDWGVPGGPYQPKT